MNLKKYLTLGISTLVLTAALGAGMYLVGQRQLVSPKAAPATTLSLTSTNASPSTGQTFTVNVNIDTASNTVSAAELHIAYTGAAVAAQSIAAGSFFLSPTVIGAQVGTGTADITILGGIGGAKQGNGVLATITFRAENAGSSTISVAPNTAVSGIGEGSQNVFVSATPVTITVQTGSNPTPTPTPAGGDSDPTPTPTQSGTNPTATPTVRPTNTPGPTPTPTRPAQGGGSVPTPIPTVPQQQLPVAGVPLPTIALLLLGGIVIFGGWRLLFPAP